MFLSAVMAPIFLALSFGVDSPVPLFFPFSVFLAGLAFMLYTLIFGDETARAGTLPARPAALRSGFGKNALGPGTNNWANDAGGRRVSTSELVQPPSVTEHTTKLLVDD